MCTLHGEKMKIGLIDVDGHNFPNIPLMKISAWHKQNGDHVEWYQPMFSGHMDVVYMSKVFSFTPDFEYHVDADRIVRGGSGYAITMEDGLEIYDKEADHALPDEIEHIYPDYELYGITDTAYGFLTRGCPRGCDFCHVARKEGRCSVKVADLSEFWNGQKHIILCDPNILACPDHPDLLKQLINSKASVEFNQGVDVRLITDRNIELLKKIRLKNVHIAFDRYCDKEWIVPKMQMMRDVGFDRHKLTVYILVNFDTTLDQDIERIQLCREMNLQPFPMIYDKKHADPIYRKLQRWCNPFIFWKCGRFEDYKRK